MRTTVSFLLILLLAAPAFAYRKPPVPSDQWDEGAQLTLAQAMVGEADWHEPDHVAIAFVLARRWHMHQANREPISFQRYISLYAASLRNDSERSQFIRSLPWGPLPGPHEQRWNRVQNLVRAWGDGRIKDPCPRAMHWGGAMDRPSRRYYPISCGLTRNIFYTHRDRVERAKPQASAKR